MEKTATPQAKPKNKHFWNFQPASGDNPPELILYGDIASETWWGDEVTPRQFTEELDALGAVPEIVVRINSGGGDVFAANAIYTRLKDNAAKITVKIDGWAASAATIIAMAGDSIEIPGNGVFMVHDPALGLLGYFNETELAKMTDELKVIKQSIVNAYMVTKGIMSVVRQIPAGAKFTVEVCNNGNDASPTWEDVTQNVVSGSKFFLSNTTKTASAWGYNFRIKVKRGTATGDCFITSAGGNFE